MRKLRLTLDGQPICELELQPMPNEDKRVPRGEPPVPSVEEAERILKERDSKLELADAQYYYDLCNVPK